MGGSDPRFGATYYELVRRTEDERGVHNSQTGHATAAEALAEAVSYLDGGGNRTTESNGAYLHLTRVRLDRTRYFVATPDGFIDLSEHRVPVTEPQLQAPDYLINHGDEFGILRLWEKSGKESILRMRYDTKEDARREFDRILDLGSVDWDGIKYSIVAGAVEEVERTHICSYFSKDGVLSLHSGTDLLKVTPSDLEPPTGRSLG